MGPGIWHEFDPPVAILDTREPRTSITVWEGTSRDGSPMCHEESDVGLASINLSELHTASGNIYIEGARGKDVLGSDSILLRSAANAQPLDRQSRGLLAYTSTVSAKSSELAGPSAVRGMDVPEIKGECTSVSLAEFTLLGGCLLYTSPSPRDS